MVSQTGQPVKRMCHFDGTVRQNLYNYWPLSKNGHTIFEDLIRRTGIKRILQIGKFHLRSGRVVLTNSKHPKVHIKMVLNHFSSFSGGDSNRRRSARSDWNFGERRFLRRNLLSLRQSPQSVGTRGHPRGYACPHKGGRGLGAGSLWWRFCAYQKSRPKVISYTI